MRHFRDCPNIGKPSTSALCQGRCSRPRATVSSGRTGPCNGCGGRCCRGATGRAKSAASSFGREALEQARQLHPDIVLMDVSMPVMDGIEATRRLKSELPAVRVIGLSMFEDDDVSMRMRQAGAEAFVSKSVSSAELLKVIYGIDVR